MVSRGCRPSEAACILKKHLEKPILSLLLTIFSCKRQCTKYATLYRAELCYWIAEWSLHSSGNNLHYRLEVFMTVDNMLTRTLLEQSLSYPSFKYRKQKQGRCFCHYIQQNLTFKTVRSARKYLWFCYLHRDMFSIRELHGPLWTATASIIQISHHATGSQNIHIY